MEESEHGEGFKVTDKRRFTSEGETSKSESSETEPGRTPESVETDRTQKASAGAEGRAEASAKRQELPPLDFSTFILSLGNTALFQLGFIKPPDAPEATKDLQGARQTIDIIALLEEKTRGNLTDQEKRIITETLFQLRLAFVEASK